MDILVKPLDAKGESTPDRCSPFRFSVIFLSTGEEVVDERIGFSEVKLKISAGTQAGRLVLIRADHELGDGSPEPIFERGITEGDGYKLLFRRYSFKEWRTDESGIWLYGCARE